MAIESVLPQLYIGPYCKSANLKIKKIKKGIKSSITIYGKYPTDMVF